jgi:purine nucleosidase
MALKVHLDTDLGGDIDDLCALALLLRWPDEIELTGITTVGELDGKRAGYIRYILELEGKTDIPVAAGAEQSLGFYAYPLGLPPEQRYWPEPVTPAPGAMDHALALLKSSIDQGARIIGIGPYTNLFLLEQQYPGILKQADLYLMGGYIYPVRPGFPQWGNDMDFNIQVDTRSAKAVLENASPTIIPLTMTVETALRRAYLPALSMAGPLGQLIARQAVEFAAEYNNETVYGLTCAGLPDDTINFQHDSLACAVALGWRDGVEITDLPLVLTEEDGWLVERIDTAKGKPTRVVTKIDPARFNQFWFDTVTGST